MALNGDYIGLHAAEREYGISVATLRRRIARGELRLYRDPLDDRRKLIRIGELEALLAPRLVQATPSERVAVSR